MSARVTRNILQKEEAKKLSAESKTPLIKKEPNAPVKCEARKVGKLAKSKSVKGAGKLYQSCQSRESKGDSKKDEARLPEVTPNKITLNPDEVRSNSKDFCREGQADNGEENRHEDQKKLPSSQHKEEVIKLVDVKMVDDQETETVRNLLADKPDPSPSTAIRQSFRQSPPIQISPLPRDRIEGEESSGKEDYDSDNETESMIIPEKYRRLRAKNEERKKHLRGAKRGEAIDYAGLIDKELLGRGESSDEDFFLPKTYKKKGYAYLKGVESKQQLEMMEIVMNENKYWKAKFEKYYKKFAKLENLYERYLSSLQNVQFVIRQR
eukprot:TRINITY_DN12483_c0_g7_i1.p1 TRINITY_DN12483_c0_g7~~TRINITY_DN12483_c0_g7_i1.p1  ORF type:complete len:323 (+),score=93.49 TRINITY_DN12483_c0_g7_i1:497-1465(+)